MTFYRSSSLLLFTSGCLPLVFLGSSLEFEDEDLDDVDCLPCFLGARLPLTSPRGALDGSELLPSRSGEYSTNFSQLSPESLPESSSEFVVISRISSECADAGALGLDLDLASPVEPLIPSPRPRLATDVARLPRSLPAGLDGLEDSPLRKASTLCPGSPRSGPG